MCHFAHHHRMHATTNTFAAPDSRTSYLLNLAHPRIQTPNTGHQVLENLVRWAPMPFLWRFIWDCLELLLQTRPEMTE